MLINYFYLISALALIYIPALAPHSLVKESSRKTMVHRHASHSESLLRHWSYWGNWGNLLKGYLGSWLLWNGAITVDAQKPNATLIEMAALNLPLVIAIAPQILRPIKGRLILLSPSIFFTGVLLGSGDLLSGVFAVIAGWCFTAAAKDSRILIPTMAISLGACTYIINGLNPVDLARVPILFLPLLASIFLQKPLIEIRAPHKLPIKI